MAQVTVEGLAILIPKSMNPMVHWQQTDNAGRIIIVNITLDKENFTLANCYFPTKNKQKEQISTLNQLKHFLLPYVEDTIILGGDFNVVLDPQLDKEGGNQRENETLEFRLGLLSFLEAFQLVDIIRTKHPDKQLSTWHSRYYNTSSRIDYIFISEFMANRVMQGFIKSAIFTDHNLVQIKLQNNFDRTRGPSYWKFNSSYLKDIEFVRLIKTTITDTSNENSSIRDKGLLWDLVKMKVRAAAINYCARIKRERVKLEKELTNEIER